MKEPKPMKNAQGKNVTVWKNSRCAIAAPFTSYFILVLDNSPLRLSLSLTSSPYLCMFFISFLLYFCAVHCMRVSCSFFKRMRLERMKDKKSPQKGTEGSVEKHSTKPTTKPTDADTTIPYTVDVPSSYSAFLSLLKKKSLQDTSILLDRMMTCNHAKISSENIPKLEVSFSPLSFFLSLPLSGFSVFFYSASQQPLTHQNRLFFLT